MNFNQMIMTTTTLQACHTLDAQDPLRTLRYQFTLPEDVIYLDGNSLGVLPNSAVARVANAVTEEWGQGLIRSWISAGWFDMPQRLGNKIAQLIGAALWTFASHKVIATKEPSLE